MEVKKLKRGGYSCKVYLGKEDGKEDEDGVFTKEKIADFAKENYNDWVGEAFELIAFLKGAAEGEEVDWEKFGVETAKKFTKADIEIALRQLDTGVFGTVLRAKGMVAGEEGWLFFDYVPGEQDVRAGSAQVIGRLCVIGSELQEHELAELFGLEA